MVLSDKSKKGEVKTMLTLIPDCLAPDSIAQACLDNIVARLDVSTNNKPWLREGRKDPGSETVNCNNTKI